MKSLLGGIVAVSLLAMLAAGCSGVRKNVAYFPASTAGTKMATSLKAVILPVADQRESAKVYPKQIIAHKSYYDEKSFDINDRPVDQVFEDALSGELYNLGISLVKADIDAPLDKETKDRVRSELMTGYPEAKVAIGMKVTDFMANSKRNFFTTDVKVNAAIELYLLDIGTGDLIWADYRAERTDTVLSASRNYMVDQLDGVLTDVMRKAVRDNLSLRDALVRAANR